MKPKLNPVACCPMKGFSEIQGPQLHSAVLLQQRQF